jgi:penicillin-binding protein 1A
VPPGNTTYRLSPADRVRQLVGSSTRSARFAYRDLLAALPNIEGLKELSLDEPMHAFLSAGRLITQFGEKQCMPITLDAIRSTVRGALLSAEDADLYEHPGVGLRGTVRAVPVC